MTNPAQYTADRLETAARAKDRSRRIAWLIQVSTALLFLWLALAVADYWLWLPRGWRFGGLAALGFLLILGLMRFIQHLRRPSRMKDIALELEARKPELGCTLSTAAEYLSGQRQATQEYEPELVAALQAQAAKKLLLVETPYHRKILRAAGVLAAACGALLLFLLLLPASLTALQRAALPWSGATYTRVEVKPGDIEMPAGRDLEIRAAFHGRPPRDPQLHWQSAPPAGWQSVALTKTNQAAWVHTLKNPQGTIRYRVSGNDAVSPDYRIRTYIPPEIKAVKVHVQYPAYTRQQAADLSAPDVSVVRASQLTFQVAASGPIAQARMRFANLPAVPLVNGEDNGWLATIPATRTSYYWIELTDADGRKGGNQKPFHLVVLPDEPPLVEVVEPGQDIRADATNKIPIRVSATDDFGVAEVKLVFHKLGGPEQSVLCRLEGDNPKELIANAEIDLAALQLREYELVAYHAEAKDYNTLDGPGIGKSPVYFIEVTTREKALSQCNGQSEKINVLDLQKQIIAATGAVKADAPPERLKDLASLQRQTKEYAVIYQTYSPILRLAPPEARQEMVAAIASMDQAIAHLEEPKKLPALAAAESALQHLYQVVRLLPELESMPCNKKGNCVPIVLDAIEKMKQEQIKKREQELAKALTQTKRLALGQQRINGIYQRAQGQLASQPPSATSKGGTPGSQPGQKGVQKNGNNGAEQDLNREGGSPQKPETAATNRPGAGQRQEADAADSQPKQGGAGMEAAGQTEVGDGADQQQDQLSQQAAALAAKLRELAGKDPRISHRFAEAMQQAAREMDRAAESWRAKLFQAASSHGGYGLSGLSEVMQGLQQLLDQPKPSDMAFEEYPKAYEEIIAEYLKRLSYAE